MELLNIAVIISISKRITTLQPELEELMKDIVSLFFMVRKYAKWFPTDA